MEDCFICRKHRKLKPEPPGSYIYEGDHWLVCHAAPNLGPLGTLFIESRRHFLDYAEMNEAEAATLGPLLKQIHQALRAELDPERIYQVMLMDGIPHFHNWFVPRLHGTQERGLKFLARDDACTEADATALAQRLQNHFQSFSL